eukprot:7944285-Pyramimonas_sp.AAC.1
MGRLLAGVGGSGGWGLGHLLYSVVIFPCDLAVRAFPLAFGFPSNDPPSSRVASARFPPPSRRLGYHDLVLRKAAERTPVQGGEAIVIPEPGADGRVEDFACVSAPALIALMSSWSHGNSNQGGMLAADDRRKCMVHLERLLSILPEDFDLFSCLRQIPLP